jgi:hypothetical protein
MSNFRGKSPSRELQEHIITGQPVNQPGHGIASDLDNPDLVREDPMEFGGTSQEFDGQSIDEITAASEAQHTGLDSAAAFGTPVDMGMASDTNVGGAMNTPEGDFYASGTGPDTTYGERGLTKWRRDNGQ